MSASPIEVVGQWLQNLLDPDVVNSVVAPDSAPAPADTTPEHSCHLNHPLIGILGL